MSVDSSRVALVISSMPVVSSVFEKYILLRFVSVNDCEPTVRVVPLMVSVTSEATDTEAFAPSVVSKVR